MTGLGGRDVVAFIATTDVNRAREFFRDTLGLTLVSEDPFACVFDAHGTPLRVTVVNEVAVAPYTVLGWTVPDIAAEIRGLTATGVTFERFDVVEQDELGVWTAPGGAEVAWFKDPDGNTLSLTQLPS